jgi:spermidine synthase
MVRSFNRLLVILFLGSSTIVALLPLLDRIRSTRRPWSPGLVGEAGLLICAALLVTAGFYFLLKKLTPFLDANALAQARFLDAWDPKYIDVAILFSAAVSLFLELAIIRWQSTVFEFFAFYKNFSLLACFIGLGIGYALAMRDRIPLLLVIPLLAGQFGFMIVVRFAPAVPPRAQPFREQLAMGLGVADFTSTAAIYAVLTVVFLSTALVFIPVGQLCGRLMEHRKKLRAYGLNLIGSLLGVLIMLLASVLWTPPLAWFALCFLAILLFHLRTPSTLIAGITFTVICSIILVWPVNPLWNRVYSPYQLLEIGHSEDTGLTLIRAAGHYYQRIHDFSADKITINSKRIREYYELPYKAHPKLADVAVVGSGTGNDVAAALRNGAGHIEAIEIDPAILLTGKTSHPEKPYNNPRVRAIINDARSFLRRTDEKFDLIVYGLLDSHTLLSQGSSVRLDSFVYTVEGLREARNRLKPDGVISLSFVVLSEALGRKIYLMLQQVFDGRPPMCVMGRYDGSTTFLESNDPNWLTSLKPDTIGFADETTRYANPSLHADVSTDDWPFFYMPQRVYPVSYLVMVFQILVLSVMIACNFLTDKLQFGNLAFFFLGAGFMLIETKGITEMGLTYGNTWQVIGFVIAGILAMAFLGNCAVQWLKIRQPYIPYLLLLSALAIGWLVARSGGFASSPLGRLETAIVLTCPLFFSGIVFSTLLSSKGQVSGLMATNLLGAICGGLLEYNSMYFGFRSLYVVAMGCYLLAFASEMLFASRRAEQVVVGPTVSQHVA